MSMFLYEITKLDYFLKFNLFKAKRLSIKWERLQAS